MTHHATPDFWACYHALPPAVQQLADKAFSLLNTDPRHPSLRFKKVGRLWSARASRGYRAVGVDAPDGVLWFWVGTHAEYNRLIK